MKGVHNSSGDHCKMVRASNIDVEEKSYEVTIVEMPDAVIHPGTVVVCDFCEHKKINRKTPTHSEDASISRSQSTLEWREDKHTYYIAYNVALLEAYTCYKPDNTLGPWSVS